MPRVARFQTMPSSSSAMERLKPWRSLSFMERTTWRRSLRDWAWGISSSMVSLAMGILAKEDEVDGHADADGGEDDSENDGVAGDAAGLPCAGAELADELEVAEDRAEGNDNSESDEGDSGPEGDAGGVGVGGEMRFCGGDLAEEEAEAADGETDAHEGEAGADPGEEGALGGEVDPGILLDGPGGGVCCGVHGGIVRQGLGWGSGLVLGCREHLFAEDPGGHAALALDYGGLERVDEVSVQFCGEVHEESFVDADSARRRRGRDSGGR